MSKVKFENSLALHEFTFGLIKSLSEQIKNIPEFKSLKLNPELTKFLCKSVNQLIDDGLKSKAFSKKQLLLINKTTLIIQILKDIFTLTDEELTQVESQIDFLNNNNLVKDKSILSNIGGFFSIN